MSKLIITETGESVNMGDSIIVCIRVNEDNIKDLLAAGTLTEISGKTVLEKGLPGVVEHLAKRINWKPENVERYINRLCEISKYAALSILLREAAIIIDEDYKGNIRNIKEYFVISPYSGKIMMISPVLAKNGADFLPLFRSKHDAGLAIKATQPLFNMVYGER